MQKPSIRKADVLLLVSIVCASLLWWGARALTATDGTVVVVTVDGHETDRYVLSENVDVVIDAYGGQNRLVIRDGRAYIAEADCTDKICENHQPISRVGDSIVCLPHRLTVTVIGNGSQPDAIIS